LFVVGLAAKHFACEDAVVSGGFEEIQDALRGRTTASGTVVVGGADDSAAKVGERRGGVIVSLLHGGIDDGVMLVGIVAADEEVAGEMGGGWAGVRSVGEGDGMGIPWGVKRRLVG